MAQCGLPKTERLFESPLNKSNLTRGAGVVDGEGDTSVSLCRPRRHFDI